MKNMTLKQMELLYWALDSYDVDLPADTAETADNVRKMLELSIWEKKQSIVKTWTRIHELCRDFVYETNRLANVQADYTLDEEALVDDVVSFTIARLTDHCAEFEPLDFDY